MEGVNKFLNILRQKFNRARTNFKSELQEYTCQDKKQNEPQEYTCWNKKNKLCLARMRLEETSKTSFNNMQDGTRKIVNYAQPK